MIRATRGTPRREMDRMLLHGGEIGEETLRVGPLKPDEFRQGGSALWEAYKHSPPFGPVGQTISRQEVEEESSRFVWIDSIVVRTGKGPNKPERAIRSAQGYSGGRPEFARWLTLKLNPGNVST